MIYYADFLLKKIKPPAKVVDIGCGKGRNSIFFAKKGFEVYGMDYIQTALSIAQDLAAQYNVANRTRFYNESIDAVWPFPDNFFDVAIDCFSSIDIETKSGQREK